MSNDLTPQADALQAQFAASEHQTRSQGGKELTYISIDSTINRMNAVLGSNWSTDDASTTLSFTTRRKFKNGTEVDQLEWDAFCQLTVHACVDGKWKKAYGVGAMTATDPDMAAKTALAEAFKKACHQYGVGLYLWDADIRSDVNKKMKLISNTDLLKTAVFQLAQQKTGIEKPDPQQIAEAFNLSLIDLKNNETLYSVLVANNAV